MRVEIIKIEVVNPDLDPNQLEKKLSRVITHIEGDGYVLAALAYMGKSDWSSGKVEHSYTAVFRGM